MVLGGVKTKDVLSLSGAGIDRAQVLASLHFPNCRDYSIFLHCVVSNLFRVGLRRRFIPSRSAYCSFVLRHTKSNYLQSHCGRFLAGRIVAHAHYECPAERIRSAISTALRGTTTPHPWRSTSTPDTRSAVSIKTRFACCGVSFGFASSMHATIDETIGAAKEVP